MNITFLLEELAQIPDTTRDDIVTLLQDIAKQLTDGVFPLHVEIENQRKKEV